MAEHPIPPLTPATALQLGTLLYAGVDALDAVVLLLPDHPLSAQITAVRQYLRSPQLLEAFRELNGAAWAELPAQRRLEVAHAKHLAELAYFLLTRSVQSMDKDEFEKAKEARKAIEGELKSVTPTDSPLARFARQALDRAAREVHTAGSVQTFHEPITVSRPSGPSKPRRGPRPS